MSEPGLSTVANTAVAATAVTTTATTGTTPATEIDLVPTTTITTPALQDLTTEAASTIATPSAAPRPDNLFVPKPKRLACMICRRRKLKCDGVKPSCSTCARLGHTCAYDEVRRKSGPKRGYVKALEERLKQVETLLKTQEPPAVAAATRESPSVSRNVPEPVAAAQKSTATPPSAFRPNSAFVSSENDTDWRFKHSSPHASGATRQQTPRAQSQAGSTPDDTGRSAYNHTIPPPMAENRQRDLVDLGLEEPLPFQDAIDELHRYLAAMTLPPTQQPPVALRYAIWTLASCVSEKYYATKDIFYQRARKYAELDYLKGFGEHIISIAHAQAHVLIASYEFKMMHFPRAWMSTGSAVRLCQMIGLNRLDSSGLDVKQCLPPPRDWTEHEERRRTFWLAFCEDRYASIGTGWPMTIDERDISTNLPSSEEAFDMSKPEQTGTLKDAMTPAGASKLSAFASVVLSSAMFGRNLIHLHRPDPEDRDHDLNGEFWKRHRQLDGILLNTLMSLPANLKLPEGLMTPNVVFVHMSMHTSTICLHQAAIFKADSYHLPANVGMESKIRCITAANEITYIMRMVAHLDLSSMNSFVAFCLYVAARVFVQYLKSQPEDSQVADSLRFLLGSMTALRRLNPLTESFLVQLDVDLDALMARNPRLHNAFPRASELPTSHPFSALAGGTYSKMPISAQLRTGFEAYGGENRFMHPPDDNGVNSQTSAANNLSPPSDSTSARQAHPPTSNSMLASQWLKISGQSNANMPQTMTTSPHSGTSVIGSVGGGDSSADPIDVAMSNHGTPSASNRPTPNSICSDHHQSDQHQQHSLHASRSIPSHSTPLNNPATSGSGHTSFNTTPVSQDHSVPPNGSSYTSGGQPFWHVAIGGS
ncbi:fungal specific transcription factor [Ceratocystis lukuohia]|uniref:Fungal specific transcription factor n=1 Tax=Ceratocystis lukuohia TaxID=2019550 RepID=A0ABR4MCE2_9PEZI